MSAEQIAAIQKLWDRMQSNEDSPAEIKKVIEQIESLMNDEAVKSNAFLLSKLKLILHKAGRECDLKALAAEFDAEAKLDPNNHEIFVCLAETYLHDQKYQEAITPLEYAQTLGNYADVLRLLSLCYRRIQPPNFQKSLDIAKAALKINMKDGKSWISVALSYLSLGGENIKNAQAALKNALKNGEEKNADALLNLGTVEELLMNFNSAMNYYEQAMVITQGWPTASAHLGRLKDRIFKALNRAEFLGHLKPKKKADLLSLIKDADDYLVAEFAGDREDPTQIILCFNKEGNVFAFGIPQTVRPYLKVEKSCLKIPNPEFTELSLDGKSIPFHVIDDPKKLNIIGGLQPHNVQPVSITSSLA